MIHFENICKEYSKELFKKGAMALRDVSFALSEQQTLGLIGANGAGKSTAIRLIMDFIRPDRGRITLFGRAGADVQQKRRIGYLPESAAFPANLTIMDLVRYTARTCGLSTTLHKERSTALLRQLGLWEVRNKRLRTYSKGMQQRANFILALLNDPDLLILDEPMSGLDPIGRRQIIDLIQQLKTEGKTILFCSHILGDVDRLVDQLLVLHKGQVLFNGQPADLLDRFGAASIEEAYLALIAHQTGGHQHAA